MGPMWNPDALPIWVPYGTHTGMLTGNIVRHLVPGSLYTKALCIERPCYYLFGLMLFMVKRKFKIIFKMVWHIQCRCSGWFGVVWFEAMAYCLNLNLSSTTNTSSEYYIKCAARANDGFKKQNKNRKQFLFTSFRILLFFWGFFS